VFLCLVFIFLILVHLLCFHGLHENLVNDCVDFSNLLSFHRPGENLVIDLIFRVIINFLSLCFVLCMVHFAGFVLSLHHLHENLVF
jgi:hypothetical protein